MSKRSVEQACGADTEQALNEVAQGNASASSAVAQGLSGIARAWRGSREALTAPIVPGPKAPPVEEWIRRFATRKGTLVVQGRKVSVEAPDGTVVTSDTTLEAGCAAVDIKLDDLRGHLGTYGLATIKAILSGKPL